MEEALDRDSVAFVKDKQTKRQRLRSPSKEGEDLGIDKEAVVAAADGLSPSMSEEECYDREAGTTMTTEEEEDMANCLILLAQGDPLRQRDVRLSPAAEEDQGFGKFTSRKYLETNTGSGKVGYYVYECKTCYRTFPSFQALGGHRASHKKPKLTPCPTVAIPSSDEEGQPSESRKYSSPSPQFGITGNGTGIPGKQGKIHECSICGAEFGSGQALGGHMRRHRAPPTRTPPPIGIPILMDSTATTTISLDLDLNLPAPDDRKAENAFLPKQQPAAALMFSSPAMVDCHY
ncbi:hypothetical protein MLD38_038073 [Melastoma candidum]|uniref:Uncharacterized protein n=1 Tax=Melastoma candidum TaxID=119954 RepID=A0ACB9KY25_9MYRT|nr:hypothetical protein MLD38_038073 [Melastoma candidum]